MSLKALLYFSLIITSHVRHNVDGMPSGKDTSEKLGSKTGQTSTSHESSKVHSTSSPTMSTSQPTQMDSIQIPATTSGRGRGKKIQQRSYAQALITGPLPKKERAPEGAQSKVAKRNQQRRERKREQKTSVSGSSTFTTAVTEDDEQSEKDHPFSETISESIWGEPLVETSHPKKGRKKEESPPRQVMREASAKGSKMESALRRESNTEFLDRILSSESAQEDSELLMTRSARKKMLRRNKEMQLAETSSSTSTHAPKMLNDQNKAQKLHSSQRENDTIRVTENSNKGNVTIKDVRFPTGGSPEEEKSYEQAASGPHVHTKMSAPDTDSDHLTEGKSRERTLQLQDSNSKVLSYPKSDTRAQTSGIQTTHDAPQKDALLAENLGLDSSSTLFITLQTKASFSNSKENVRQTKLPQQSIVSVEETNKISASNFIRAPQQQYVTQSTLPEAAKEKSKADRLLDLEEVDEEEYYSLPDSTSLRTSSSFKSIPETDEHLIEQMFSPKKVHALLENQPTPKPDYTGKVSTSETIDANALTIVSTIIGKHASVEIEKSNIDLNAFGVTDLVKLESSGVIAKCGSKGEANNLKEAILQKTEGLDIELTYFLSHIVCMYDVPSETKDAEINSIIVRKYSQLPRRVHFLSYETSWKENSKIALLDVDSSLLAKIKASPYVEIGWNQRYIHILLESQDRKQQLSLEMEDYTTTLSPSSSRSFNQNVEVVINDLPANITAAEIREMVTRKFKETPRRIKIFPYEEKLDKKSVKLEISEELLRKIMLSPYIRIRWAELEIQTPSKLYRCRKCHLLGHITKFCRRDARPPPTIHEMCLDCTNFNENNGSSRDVNHRTDSNECPTKMMYAQRCLKRSPSNLGDDANRSDSSEGRSSIQSPKSEKNRWHHVAPTPLGTRSQRFSDRASHSSETSHPASTNSALDDALSETIEQSAEQILAKVLPALNKSIVEVVDRSVQQNLAKILPTPPTENDTDNIVSSVDQSVYRQGNNELDTPETSESDRHKNIAVFVRANDPIIDVTKELGTMVINTNVSIDWAVFYPSGDVLLFCDSVEGAKTLQHAIRHSPNLKVLPWRGFPIKVRVDAVPEEVTPPEIAYAVFQKYKESPKRSIFHPYKNPWIPKTKLAILDVSEPLLREIEASPDIQVRGHELKIDFRPRSTRCENCQLYGHPAFICRLERRPRPELYENCVDCCHYNRRMGETKLSFIPRDENHATGDVRCLSKIATRNLNPSIRRRELESNGEKSVEKSVEKSSSSDASFDVLV